MKKERKLLRFVFSSVDLPISKRRVVQIISPEKFLGGLPFRVFRGGIFALLEPIWQKYTKNCIMLNLDEASSKFKFLPEYPLIDGGVYVCSDVFPELYLPPERFSDYLIETKINALHSMCASLGAKSCKTIHMVINGEEVNLKASGAITSNFSVGIKGKISSSTIKIKAIDDRFSEPSEIKRTNSVWLDSEPSWVTMQETRLNEKTLERREVNMSITRSMGGSAEILAACKKASIKLGVDVATSFKVEMTLAVDFYPYPESSKDELQAKV